MDLEETKKIIESEIEAGELTREVRSQIKTYIDQKQNLREGFKETFQPLIETQEAVKAIIDKEQNAMIKQLQENQKVLTEGFEGNRLPITSGFDKMDEVKRLDLDQLPLEAIKEPEKENSKPAIKGREITYKISNTDLNKLAGFTSYDESEDAFYNKEQYDDLLEKKYSVIEKYLSPDLIKLEVVPKIKDDPIYKISINDFYRINGEENKIKKDGENKFAEYKESEIDRIISEKN